MKHFEKKYRLDPFDEIRKPLEEKGIELRVEKITTHIYAELPEKYH